MMEGEEPERSAQTLGLDRRSLAAAAFDTPKFISGTMRMDPLTQKDEESTHTCSQFFCVISCQVRVLNRVIGPGAHDDAVTYAHAAPGSASDRCRTIVPHLPRRPRVCAAPDRLRPSKPQVRQVRRRRQSCDNVGDDPLRVVSPQPSHACRRYVCRAQAERRSRRRARRIDRGLHERHHHHQRQHQQQQHRKQVICVIGVLLHSQHASCSRTATGSRCERIACLGRCC